MSYYVDEIKRCMPLDETGGRWRWNNYCHLMADTVDELHAAALAVGLKRDYFQNLPGFPHYDLTVTKRRVAVRLGAVQITCRDMVQRAADTYGLKNIIGPRLTTAATGRFNRPQ